MFASPLLLDLHLRALSAGVVMMQLRKGAQWNKKRRVVVALLVTIFFVWIGHTLWIATHVSSERARDTVRRSLPTTEKQQVSKQASSILLENTSHRIQPAKKRKDSSKKKVPLQTSKPTIHEAKTTIEVSPFSQIGNHRGVSSGEPLSVPYWEAVGPFAPVAYLLIISNEDFLDGALVLGRSLRQNCPRLSQKTADLAIIITQNRVSRQSQLRLHSVGFDRIFEVPSLATRAPGAYWKDTFDKIYMFNLTQYRKIVFMDADMINVRSMDALFDKDFGDPTYVGAIGFRGGSEGPYFQTGMMVIQPTRAIFDKIYARFESGVPPRGSMYNHGMNGRDGVLLRDVFGNNFKILDNKYSRNLNPRWPVPEVVVSLHLRGKVKPWFDRNLPNTDPELGKKEFGHPYELFWRIYEELIHKESPEYKLALQGLPLSEPFGGSKSAPDVSPLTHVWMMRYSPREYVQLLTEEDRRRRNKTIPTLKYVVGEFNQSCVDACGKSGGRQCSHEALYYSKYQDCQHLRDVFAAAGAPCDKCELGVYWRPHPGSDYPALDKFKGESICKYNLLYDERGRPNCTAKYELSRRLCPCV